MECQIDIFGAIRHVIRQVIIDFSFSGSEDEKPVRKGDREHEQGRRGVKPTSQGRLSGGGHGVQLRHYSPSVEVQ
jgi:hypothetical protein